MKKYEILKKADDYIIFKVIDENTEFYFEDIDLSDIPFENYQECEDYSQYGYCYDKSVIIVEKIEDSLDNMLVNIKIGDNEYNNLNQNELLNILDNEKTFEGITKILGRNVFFKKDGVNSIIKIERTPMEKAEREIYYDSIDMQPFVRKKEDKIKEEYFNNKEFIFIHKLVFGNVISKSYSNLLDKEETLKFLDVRYHRDNLKVSLRMTRENKNDFRLLETTKIYYYNNNICGVEGICDKEGIYEYIPTGKKYRMRTLTRDFKNQITMLSTLEVEELD